MIRISEKPSLGRHLAVLQALIIRNLMARFGRENLGFFWFVLEPGLLTAGVIIIWSVIHDQYIHNVPVIAFVFTGYMPLTLWRHLTNPAVRIFHNNVSLFYHRPITYGHILISRLALEFFSVSAALTVIYLMLMSIGVIDPVADPELVLAGWLLTGWFYGALSLNIAAVTERWEVAERFVQPFQYFALPLSGVFFMVDWLPGWGQAAIVYNPAVHCTEMFRAGFFGEGFMTFYDPWYLIAWCAFMTVSGAAGVYHVRDHIRLT